MLYFISPPNRNFKKPKIPRPIGGRVVDNLGGESAKFWPGGSCFFIPGGGGEQVSEEGKGGGNKRQNRKFFVIAAERRQNFGNFEQK